MNRISSFLNDKSGTATVNWIVLTTAILGNAFAVLLLISGGVNEATSTTSAEVDWAGASWDAYVSNSRNGGGLDLMASLSVERGME